MRRLFLFGAVLAAVLCGALRGEVAIDESYSCTICHGDKKNSFLADVHYGEGILCETCHGGDSRAMDETAHSKALGFKGDLDDEEPPFSKKQIVVLCSSCHSDAKRMMRFGLPSNQEQLYRISFHGKALYGRNDEKVAVCTDCHGVHMILPASDPRSRVYVRNLPETCASCHSDKELMEKYDLPWDAFEKFRKSIHGVALFDKNDQRSPNCAVCHGVHGASPPQISEIENVCGQCHHLTREYFNDSPHRGAMEAGIMRECIDCHGAHAIEKATLGLFDTSCTGCHDPSSGPYRRGQTIKALVLEAAGSIEDAREEMDEALRTGIDITGYEQELEEAVTNLLKSAPVTHTLSVAEVEKLARKAMAVAEDVKIELYHRREEIEERKFILIVIWAFILLMIPVTVVKRYRVRKRLQEKQ